MYLSKLKIWNFRKFGTGLNDIKNRKTNPDFEIGFNPGLNVLVGANDAGKTAIIDAIRAVLDTHSGEWRYSITEDDFTDNAEELRIECIFEGMRDDEAKNFIEWLNINDGTQENNGTQLKVFLTSNKKGKFNRPYTIIKAGFDDEGYDISYEAREYLKTVYLKPLRDVENDFVPRRNSRISQILMGDDAFKDALSVENGKNHDLTKVFAEFNNIVERYFRGEKSKIVINDGGISTVDDKGKAIGEKINKRLDDFFSKKDTKESRFTITKETLKDLLENLELGFKEGKKHGLGSLNRLFIAAELLHLNKSDWTGLRLGLIEEIEAHLHPQAQLKVIESLQKDENNGVQLILTTHSPNLTSKVKLKNLILIGKVAGGTEQYASFALTEEKTKLTESDVKKLEKFLDVTKSNLFFANGVILVEGWAEELIVPELAKLIGYDLTEYGVSVINVAGINFKEYARVFQVEDGENIDIPVGIITDNDIYDGMKEDKKEGQESKNETINKLEGQSVQVFWNESWTLEWALFKSVALGDKMKTALRKVHPNVFSDDNSMETELSMRLKSQGGKISKTEIAYSIAEQLNTMTTDLDINPDDSIHYIVDAIKHACGDLT